MAIIYSYPLTTPKVKDLLIGTSIFDEDDENSPRNNPTVSFTIQSLVDMIAPGVGGQTLQQVTNLGATTTNAITIANGLSVNGTFTDSSGGVGIAGQVLSSTNIGTSWVSDNAGLNYYVTGATFDTATGILAITGNNALVGASIDLDGRYLIANQTITLSGDVIGTGATAIATTLATVNANVGAFTNANITVNAKGLVTAASDGSSGGVSSIVAGTNITLSPVTGLGDVTINSTYSYTLPVATTVALGGVKIGYIEAGKNYPVELDSDQMYVNVPWTDTPYTLPVATNTDLGGVKIGYTDNAKNYAVELDSDKMYVNVPWTDTPYVLPLAADGTRGGVQIGYTQTATRDYPVTLDSEKMLVTVPWTDTQNPFQTITGTGTANASTGIILSDNGGTVLLNGTGSVTVTRDAATSGTIVINGTDTGITTVVVKASTISTGFGISKIINARELELYPHYYAGTTNVGFVPTGGSATTFLRGDGSWGAIPTGLTFKGTWDARDIAEGGASDGGDPNLDGIAGAVDGWLYIVSVAGSAVPNGAATTPNSWNIGDWCVFDGTNWTRVPSSTTGVTTFTSNFTSTGVGDPQYISGSTLTADTGGVDIGRVNLNATGTQDSTTFLRGDNTWGVPAYIPNTDETYDLNAGAKVGTSVPINLTSTSGTDDSLVNLKEGTNITLTRGSATEITIAAADTDTGITGVTLAVGTSTGAPLTESIATRELTLTSMVYDGTTNVGHVPTGGSATTFLRGDATWVVPTDTQLGVATTTVLGGIELGSATVLNTAFVGGNTGSTTRSYPVQLNAARQAAVYVPWTSGGTYSWTVKDDDTGSSAVVSADSIEFVTATGDLATTLTEPSAGAFVMTLTSPNTTYSTVSTSAAGLAPTLPAAVGGKFLRADATWEVPPTGPNDNDYVDGASYATGTLTLTRTGGLADVTATGFLQVGTAAADAMAGDTTTISATQTADITANNAKVGITTAQADEITANTLKVGITTTQADEITANTAKVGITTTQADEITANTAKVGITTTQASNIVTNNAKVGITTSQAADIVTNSAKVGITTTQAANIVTNNAKVSMVLGTTAGTALAGNTVIPQGDITNVTAGTDLSGGGASGSVTLNNTSTLATVCGRGSTTGTSITMNGSGANGYLYVAGNAATTAPTNDQGMAFAYNNGGGTRENELFFNPGIVTPAENATYYFALINQYLNSSSSNARTTDTLFKLYGNGNLELTGPVATSTIANTYWRMPKSAAPGTGYYLSKHSSTIDLVWTAPPIIPQGTVTSVTAGTGMTQTGTSTINPTLNVIAGNGLTANANNITMSGSYTGDLTITGDAVTDSYRFRANHANPTTSTATLYDQSSVGATISAYRFAVRNSDGTNMLASALFTDTSLTVVGDVIAFGSPSDVRLKENIKPIESALDKAMKLQGVTFDWKKSDSILDIKEDIGFIAQDVQKVIPELVKENKDGMLSMRHQGIAPILLEAIKELKAEIEELKSNKCNCNK